MRNPTGISPAFMTILRAREFQCLIGHGFRAAFESIIVDQCV